MRRSVLVDISRLRPPGSRVPARIPAEWLGRLRDVHGLLGEPGWAHRAALACPSEPALRLAEALRAEGRALVVAGPPGPLRAARAWVEALAPEAPVRWIDGPGGAPAGEGEALVAWPGPAWVDGLYGAARAAGVPTRTVDRAEADLLDPCARDGRHAVLGPGARMVAAFAGIDVASAVAGARAMADDAARPALYENPAYALALGLAFAERRLGRPRATWMVAHPGLLTAVAHLARAWVAAHVGAPLHPDVAEAPPAEPTVGVWGDQELVDGVHLALPHHALLALDVDDLAPEADRTGARAWLGADVPMVRVVLPRLDAAALGGLFALLDHAAAASAVFRWIDPRRRPGAAGPIDGRVGAA